jgi:hypothetical protein
MIIDTVLHIGDPRIPTLENSKAKITTITLVVLMTSMFLFAVIHKSKKMDHL